MTHYNVQCKSVIPELGTVRKLEQERFQGTLENRRGTHQLEFCWQAVPCTGGPSRRISELRKYVSTISCRRSRRKTVV